MSRFLALLAFPLLVSGAVAAQEYPEREFSMGLYIWGPELEGVLEADRITAEVDASFSDILKNTNIAVFGLASGRIGRFVGLFDGMWLELEDEIDTGTLQLGPITLGPAEVDAQIRQGMADLKLGYRILEPDVKARQPVSIDLLAGGRYWYMDTDIDIELALPADRSFDEIGDWVDPVVGLRVILGLTPKLQLSVTGDVGGWGVGSASDHTWTAAALLGIELSEAWNLRLGYREIDFERGDADIELRGPVIGAIYQF
jgi:hypothetical protein